MARHRSSLAGAAGVTLLGFASLFLFQVLWTHDRLEQFRSLGRRGLHRTRGTAAASSTQQQQQQQQKGSSGKAAKEGVTERLERLAMQTKQKPVDGIVTSDSDEGAGWLGGGASSLGNAGDGSLLPGGPGALPDPAVIVFCFNRTEYLNQTLHSLLGLQGLHRFSVYVSQDGNDAGVAELVGSLEPAFKQAARGFGFWQKHPRVAQLPGGNQPGHAWLAQHYKWGLSKAFDEGQHSHVVIVEDDMIFSPDFLLYFEATSPLLDADPSLWCISSWNDNGFIKGHHWDVRRLFRTSYFPGLGWMMKRDLWQELGPLWPMDHWDHWMRDEEVSKGRECISPEVNRNKNIGEEGANMNKQAFKRYLKTMAWNENVTAPHFGDLSSLLRPAYEAALQAALASAQPWEFNYRKDAPQPERGQTYLVTYVVERFTRAALRLKLWPYPRGHTQHVAVIPWEGSRFLVADRRFCPLLPQEQQLPPTEGMRPLPGRAWQSCKDVCAEGGLVCAPRDFWWLNSCAVMRKHFPCEKGCTIELGPDVPAYVTDANQTLHQYCLITQARHCTVLPCHVLLCLSVPHHAGRAPHRTALFCTAMPVCACLHVWWNDNQADLFARQVYTRCSVPARVGWSPIHNHASLLHTLCTIPPASPRHCPRTHVHTPPMPPLATPCPPQKSSTCAAKHASTARLCACVPDLKHGAGQQAADQKSGTGQQLAGLHDSAGQQAGEQGAGGEPRLVTHTSKADGARAQKMQRQQLLRMKASRQHQGE